MQYGKSTKKLFLKSSSCWKAVSYPSCSINYASNSNLNVYSPFILVKTLTARHAGFSSPVSLGKAMMKIFLCYHLKMG